MMESCSICFLSFSEYQAIDGYTITKKSRIQKFLSCGHSLCLSCYFRLQQTKCPFCRTVFTYSDEDLLILNKSKIVKKTNNTLVTILGEQNEQLNTIWQPPQTTQLEYDYDYNRPFTRLKKQMSRKRRRNLSFDEVIQRRKNIKKRCDFKWTRKNGRLVKETGYF